MLRSLAKRHIGGASILALTAGAVVADDLCTAGPNGITIEKSMVVTDDGLLSNPDAPNEKFGLERTLNRILATMPFGPMEQSAEAREFLLQSMLNSLTVTERVNLASGLRMRVSPRPAEAALTAKDLLSPKDLLDPEPDPKKKKDNPRFLVPTGLFNRFDLTPDDRNNCGEYRIVYSFRQRIEPPAVGKLPDRFFLIFEARLDNPTPVDPNSGLPSPDSCRPVAEFWRNLTDSQGPGPALEQFFYEDGAVVPPFKSAVRAEHFGFPLGQVRGNIFVEDIWQLREWRIGVADSGAGPQFIPVTVRDNPLVELYQDVNPDSLDVAREDTERAAFADAFLKGNVPEADHSFLDRLLDADRKAVFGLDTSKGFPSRETQIIGALGARFHDRFNEFQGVSQGHSDNPSRRAENTITNGINETLPTLNPPFDVNTKNMLNRAGALTCGGCHQFSNGQLIGSVDDKAVAWPNSAGFVHIREPMPPPPPPPPSPPPPRLSDALTQQFLPFRRWVLWKELCEPAPPAPPPAVAQIRRGSDASQSPADAPRQATGGQMQSNGGWKNGKYGESGWHPVGIGHRSGKNPELTSPIADRTEVRVQRGRAFRARP
jgi:hypothetical protein